jgi:hypothetical protein
MTAEDKDMEVLMAKWEKENNVEDVSESDADTCDDEPLGYDDMLEKYRRKVTPTNNAIDHIVLGTSDLDKAIDDFEAMTGVRPLMVVSHNGLGTKSARVAFESCAFLEFLGPDPKQSGNMPMAQKLAKIPEGKLVPIHYAIYHDKAADFKKTTWSDMGLECDQVTMIAKDRSQPWKWDMFFLEGHEEEGLMPFFINWGDSQHAAGRLPIVGTLNKVTVHSSDDKVKKLVQGVKGIEYADGADLLEVSFKSSKGTHVFTSNQPIGIAFPK